MAGGGKTKVMQHLLVMETVPKNRNSNGALDRPHLTEQHRMGNRMAGQMGGREALCLRALRSDTWLGTNGMDPASFGFGALKWGGQGD
jgi:hypothetical protein